jgi:hypothetical protein
MRSCSVLIRSCFVQVSACFSPCFFQGKAHVTAGPSSALTCSERERMGCSCTCESRPPFRKSLIYRRAQVRIGWVHHHPPPAIDRGALACAPRLRWAEAAEASWTCGYTRFTPSIAFRDAQRSLVELDCEGGSERGSRPPAPKTHCLWASPRTAFAQKTVAV